VTARNRFENKRVLVTGVASGFGQAIAAQFAAEGAVVMGADRDPEGADAMAELGGQFHLTDVSSGQEMQTLIGTTVEQLGGLDVLVNNAGYSHMSMLMWKLPEEEFDGVFAVNVKGVFLGCKYAIPYMIESGGGVIINTASVGAEAPRPGVTAYNATKGAVVTMTKGLALEVARHNIRVNAVNPVAADTGFMKGAMGVDSLSDDQKATLVSSIPRGRLCEPRDVANAVLFLASEDADLITGTCLNVDGGRSI